MHKWQMGVSPRTTIILPRAPDSLALFNYPTTIPQYTGAGAGARARVRARVGDTAYSDDTHGHGPGLAHLCSLRGELGHKGRSLGPRNIFDRPLVVTRLGLRDQQPVGECTSEARSDSQALPSKGLEEMGRRQAWRLQDITRPSPEAWHVTYAKNKPGAAQPTDHLTKKVVRHCSPSSERFVIASLPVSREILQYITHDCRLPPR